MPTFSIESPQTGQTYRVQFEREPSPADLDFAAQQFDKEWWQQQGIEPGSAITQQTPLGTFTNAVANVGPTLAGMVGGGMRYLDKAAEVVAQATGTERGGLFGDIAQQAEAIQAEGDVLRPLNPANPTARTLGQGAAQGLGMLGTAAASVPALGARGLMAVPAALGFGAGAGEGVQQAEAMGLSPVGQLAQGTAFGAAEAATEALGGIGGAVLRPARTLAGRALGGLASETLEEPAAGMLQEAITNVAALPVRDPARPGYTRTGFPIPGPEGYLDRRAQEALGGAAGGLVFAGAQAAAAYGGRPGADNLNASVTDRTERAAADKTGEQVIGAGSTPAAGSISNMDAGLGGIAARAGSVEVESLLPPDGYAAEEQLTAADVQDLETGGQGNGEMGNTPPVTFRQPILTNVPDAAPNVPPQGVGQTVSDPVGDISAAPGAVSPAQTAVSEMDILPVNPAIQDPPQTITGSNEQTGSEMPVPPPTAEAGAGAGGRVQNAESLADLQREERRLYALVLQPGGQQFYDQWISVQRRRQALEKQQARPFVLPQQDAAERLSTADTEQQRRQQIAAEDQTDFPATVEPGVEHFVFARNARGQTVEVGGPYESAAAAVADRSNIFDRMPATMQRDTVGFSYGKRTAAPNTPATTPAPAAAAMPSPATGGGQVGNETGTSGNVAPTAVETQAPRPLNPTANMPTPGEAGFVNADLLGELARAAIQAGKDFATWAREMVARFGEAIRSQLAAIWQQATAQVRGAEVRFGGTVTPMAPAAERGFVSTGTGTSAAVPEGMAETRARYASPDMEENLYEVEPVAVAKAGGVAWLDSVPVETALRHFEQAVVPPGMTQARMFYAHGELLQRLTAQTQTGSEAQRIAAEVLLNRAGRAWHGKESQEWGRAGVARATVGADLLPIAPVLAAKQVLVDRAEAVLGTRFEGGAKGAVEKVLSLHERVMAMLPNLLNNLRLKIASGMTWAEIFTDMPAAQKERQREIYRRLMLDERMKGLTAEERLALTHELDKAWQRERRKVFQQELKKAGLVGEKDAPTRQKVVNGLPKLLRLMNLGVLSADTFREAMAPEFNLRSMTGADVLRLRDIFNAAYKAPPGIQRNRLLQKGLLDMQKITGSTKVDLLNNVWVASVLSGSQTLFDTATTLATGGLLDTLTSAIGVAMRGKPDVAITAVAEFWRSLPQLLREAGRILGKGELWYLRQFADESKRGLEGLGIGSAITGERLLSEKEISKRALGLLLAYVGRSMAAFDHLTNNATKAGALPIARALNPDLYPGPLVPSALDKANARAQAKLEMPTGTPVEIERRAREILENGINPQMIEEAEQMGDIAAFQNDPTGFYGGIYEMIKSFFGSGERSLNAAADKMAADSWARTAVLFMAGSLRAALGAKFIRFAMNWANKQTMLVPGTYLIQKAGVPIFGSQISRTQANYILGRNVVGMAMVASFYAFLRAALDKDDDEEGWHLTGGLEGVSSERITALRAAGVERLTLWKRDAQGRVVRQVNYKNMPFAAMLAALASTSDERKYLPEKHAQRTLAGHLGRALAIGAMQFKDISAVEGLSDLFQKPKPGSTSEVAEDFIERLAKSAARFTTGFIPNALRDVDSWTDSRYFKPETAAAEWVKGVPFLRRTVNDGRPLLNYLGEEVNITRAPWNRQVKDVATSEAGRVLGGLLSRGLNVPGADGDGVVVVKNGKKVLLSSLGPATVYAYQKAVGEGYKEWLGSAEGQRLLTLPPAQAADIIENRAKAIKRRARVRAVGD